MGKTIEERLDKIIMDIDNSGYYDMREKAAIIAECNELVAAAKAVWGAVTILMEENDDIKCHHLHGMHAPWVYLKEDGRTAMNKLRAAIIKMEGN